MQAGAFQDAMEYFQHLLEYMSRCERSAAGRLGEPMAPPTADAFRFEVIKSAIMHIWLHLICCASGNRVAMDKQQTQFQALLDPCPWKSCAVDAF